MRWFHDKDGGLIKVKTSPDGFLDKCAYCSICGERWGDFGVWVISETDWVSFANLSEDLQAAALEEML